VAAGDWSIARQKTRWGWLRKGNPQRWKVGSRGQKIVKLPAFGASGCTAPPSRARLKGWGAGRPPTSRNAPPLRSAKACAI